jgi:hypothetical protein
MIVTITAYKRPELLKRCLESIVAADHSCVDQVIISEDWHSLKMSDAMLDVIMPFLHRLSITRLTPYPRMGVANNPRNLYNYAAHNFWDEKITALEEDVTVSHDAFLYADWALRQGYGFVNLVAKQDSFGGDPSRVHEDCELRGMFGWAFRVDDWFRMEPQWNGKIREPYGIDWQITHLCYREGWTVLTPELSRVFNTGREGGTYDTPAAYDSRPQNFCVTSPDHYELVKHPNLDRTPPAWVLKEMEP